MLQVRSAVGSSVAGPLAQAARGLEPELPVRIRTMHEATGFSLIPVRIAGQVLGTAGILGLGLALVGVFGVVAYAVSQRAREMGIRLALGATRRRLLQMVVAQGLRPVVVGLAAGILAALATSRLLRGLLIGVEPLNLESAVGVPLLLVGAGILAALIPARRATREDPVAALRVE